MNEVGLLAHPLTGLSLIEASAGTGKTTTLVRLYLRALLVDGLSVEHILAVTYTRAATGELSVRVRAELAEAAAQLDKAEPDEPWKRLFAAAGSDRDVMQRRIAAALAAFDDKAVFTIHGFCQRMLADHAFEAATPFAATQSDDETALNEEVAADFWRRRTASDNADYVRWFVDTFCTPRGLLERLRRVLAVSGTIAIEPRSSVEAVKGAEADFAAAVLAARETWSADSARLQGFLNDCPGLNGNSYKPATVARLVLQWEQWLQEPPSPSLPDKFELLTACVMQAKTNKGESAPAEPFFAAAEALLAAAERLKALWWQESFAAAREFFRAEARRRKREARKLGFDDMLACLRDALDAEGGERLAARIAARYPLILVDEFQDTDPVQHEIFMRVHAAGKGHGLILIGDPKQAIYRFRGADIFTYMRVRGECRALDRLYGLTHNYRSTENLLAALNALFAACDNPFEYEAIPYVPVRPGRPVAPLEWRGESEPPMTVLWASAWGDEAGKINKDEAERRAADVAADEIAHLLEFGAADCVRHAGQPVQAGDVAVLVNVNRQGALVQRALRRRGIAAAMVATESVFRSPEAAELQDVLAAVAEPANGGRLRRALATTLLGATARDLAAWASDESRWSDIVADFRAYREWWQTEGFATMFARLLNEQGAIGRTLARTDGERAMTNLRHLAELAGDVAARQPGIATLIAWLARERESAVRDDARQLRLESDENLVRIATVHRAKGLQYPVVFLPFPWATEGTRNGKANPAVLAHDDDYRLRLDLGSQALAARQAQADREARAEAARRTYVALTRAECACYMIAVPARGVERSAFARLLNVEEPAAFETGLRTWIAAAGEAATIRSPVSLSRHDDGSPARLCGEARVFSHSGRLRQRFHVASYSLLAAGASGGAIELPDWDESVEPTLVAETATGIHAFPAGAASGSFFHALIEALDFAADAGTIAKLVQTQSAAWGIEPRWADVLSSWLEGFLATPLGAPACTLADVASARRLNELEFYFPLNTLTAPALDEAVAGFAPRVPRPPLRFDRVAGQMKGYLDLVFEHGGRYWIADYKSNRLGGDLVAYTPAALDRAMAEHRYDLQYLIYTVALHRYLQARIADYDYERHFGGVLYLFLRGMAPDAPAPRGVWHTRPDRREVERLDAFLAGAAS